MLCFVFVLHLLLLQKENELLKDLLKDSAHGMSISEYQAGQVYLLEYSDHFNLDISMCNILRYLLSFEIFKEL